jgi:hypothetical protein
MLNREDSNMRRQVTIIIGVILAFILLILSFWIVEDNNAKDILCIQDPLDGDLHWYTTAGIKPQWFGTSTLYPKLQTYEFEIAVRFNDGGHGTIKGSLNYELPLANDTLLAKIHTTYGNADAVQEKLVKVVTNKCVYMTGPLMSSKESYAEKRTSLIFYIEDQIKNGVYKTVQRDIKIKDPITGNDKTSSIAEIVINKETGRPERQEDPVLSYYGIVTSNFAVTELPYDETVEAQIKQQQSINMDVQTSMAEAKKAEQRVITVTKNGEADAAKAKWEQEVIKARQVTEAQQKLEVARLNALSAEQNKRASILEGEGEAAKRRLIMSADGALQVKGQLWLEAQKAWAEAWSKNGAQIVPTISSGGTAGNSNALQNFLELQSARTAKELGLNMNIKGQ